MAVDLNRSNSGLNEIGKTGLNVFLLPVNTTKTSQKCPLGLGNRANKHLIRFNDIIIKFCAPIGIPANGKWDYNREHDLVMRAELIQQ